MQDIETGLKRQEDESTGIIDLDYTFKVDEIPKIYEAKQDKEPNRENKNKIMSFDYWKVYFDLDIDMLWE